MPMIDVYIPDDLLAPDAAEKLGTDLAYAVLRAEGHTEEAIAPIFTTNTAAFVHRLPVVTTAAAPRANAVRVQIITPPGSLNRDGQRQITAEATAIIGGLAPGATVWVVLTEAAEGGWGIGGTAYGKEEFAALARP